MTPDEVEIKYISAGYSKPLGRRLQLPDSEWEPYDLGISPLWIIVGPKNYTGDTTDLPSFHTENILGRPALEIAAEIKAGIIKCVHEVLTAQPKEQRNSVREWCAERGYAYAAGEDGEWEEA